MRVIIRNSCYAYRINKDTNKHMQPCRCCFAAKAEQGISGSFPKCSACTRATQFESNPDAKLKDRFSRYEAHKIVFSSYSHGLISLN